ncbi:hypothetical protein ABZP36_036134 [Zizania latifolia]
MRRRPGIAGLQNAAATRDQFRLVGENVAKVRTDVMKEQLATFRTQLEEFACKHKNDIRKNPLFRQQFHEMCAKVGVDPLASNKGAWAELLGIGDFYYELGVQIVDICIATRSHNGGLIDLLDLRKQLCQKRKADLGSLTADDCLRAISKLKLSMLSSISPVLGSGFEVISVGKKKLVRSVPTELNKDHNGILELAQAEGFVTVEQIEKKFLWSTGRAIDVLETLLKEGLAMIDDGHKDASADTGSLVSLSVLIRLVPKPSHDLCRVDSTPLFSSVPFSICSFDLLLNYCDVEFLPLWHAIYQHSFDMGKNHETALHIQSLQKKFIAICASEIWLYLYWYFFSLIVT